MCVIRVRHISKNVVFRAIQWYYQVSNVVLQVQSTLNLIKELWIKINQAWLIEISMHILNHAEFVK